MTEDRDQCPDEPEDRDGDRDDDGCPDDDRDGDGIADDIDHCRSEAEDRDGIADEDGCAEADVDGDGVLDGADGCQAEREDVDGVADEDGCADADDDADGVADELDPCPRPPDPTDSAAVAVCEREALAAAERAAASAAAWQREWAFFVDLWPIGLDTTQGEAPSAGLAVSGIGMWPITRDARGTSTLAPYLGGTTSVSLLGASGARPTPMGPIRMTGAEAIAVDLRLDAGVAIGPLAVGASARLGYAGSVGATFGPSVGAIVLNDRDDDLVLWAQVAWLPDVYDAAQGLASFEACVRLALADRLGFSVRLRYHDALDDLHGLSLLGGATFALAEGVDEDIARDVARPSAASMRENALLVGLWPVGYLSIGDTFAMGAMVSALGIVPTTRDESGTSVVAAYFAATASLGVGIFASGGVPIAFDLRGDAGLALGPLVLAGSARLSVVDGAGSGTVGGTAGPTLGLVLLGREGDPVGVVGSLSWLPDVHGDSSWANVDIGAHLTFFDTVGMSVRLRYDEQLDGRREVLWVQGGLSLLFRDFFGG